MSKWEYLSFTFRPDQLDDFHAELNQFGNLGWEMIGMTSVGGESILDKAAATLDVLVVFKRPKE